MKAQCTQCGITEDIPVSKEQYDDWRSGTLIQNAMPHLNPAQRELLISGTCGACFDKMFRGE
jgi:hypothetical protein